jgi:hypothetical protein
MSSNSDWRARSFEIGGPWKPVSQLDKQVALLWQVGGPVCNYQTRCLLIAVHFVLKLLRAGLYNVVEDILSLCNWLDAGRVLTACDFLDSGVCAFKSVATRKSLLERICRGNSASMFAGVKFCGRRKPGSCPIQFENVDLHRLQNLNSGEDFLREGASLMGCRDTWKIDSLTFHSTKEPLDIQFNPAHPLIVVQASSKNFIVYRYSGELREKLGQIVYCFDCLEGTVEGLSWSPNGQLLAGFVFEHRRKIEKRLLMFVYTANGTMHEIAFNNNLFLVKSPHTNKVFWRGSATFLYTSSANQVFECTLVDSKLRRRSLICSTRDVQFPGNTELTQVLALFCAPDLTDLIFFVLGNCNRGHSHSRIGIYNSSKKTAEKMINVPGFVMKFTAQKSTVAVLFTEPTGYRLRNQDLNEDKGYSGLATFAENGGLCNLLHTPNNILPRFWRLFLIREGIRIDNILDSDR